MLAGGWEGGTARRTFGNGVDGFDSPWHTNKTTGGVLLQMGMQVGIRKGRRERCGASARFVSSL